MKPSGLGPLALCTLLVSTALAQVDHRRSQSPVKDQGGRGTCVAFSICAALETFPGVPTDLSEQLLYATVKRHENGVDGWLRKLGRDPQMKTGNTFETYVPLFSHVGTSHESLVPYNPNPLQLPKSVPDEVRAFLELTQFTEESLDKVRDAVGKYGFREADCTVLGDGEATDVARLKRELDAGRLAIPVTYVVHGPNWSAADDDPKRERTVIHPGLLFRMRLRGDTAWNEYGNVKLRLGGKDFAAAIQSGEVELERYPDPDEETKVYGGHAVTIVGYDERGFLCKNSWGEGWGDGGYCTVLFDYHSAFAMRALLIDAAYIRTPQLSPFAQSAGIRDGRMRVKVQPIGAGQDARLELSSWTLESRDPDVEVFEYTVELRGKDGRWQELLRQPVPAGPRERRNGAPVQLRGEALQQLRAATQARVTVRYGGTQLDAAHPTYSRTIRFAPFAAAIDKAVDLQPEN
ncbi:MAG: C1 family peptidase [Planctomycetota bacterium]